VLHKTENPLTKITWRSHTNTRKRGQLRVQQCGYTRYTEFWQWRIT